MIPQKLIIGLLALGFISCNSKQKPKNEEAFQDIKVVGAMKNVMWKGKLEGSIHIDTISDKNGLYGLGPVSFLTGEIVINIFELSSRVTHNCEERHRKLIHWMKS